MKCFLKKMRYQGVVVPRRELTNEKPILGELAISDTRDEGVYRVIKTARFTHHHYSTKSVEILFEPLIVWVNEGRFTLKGFERVARDGKVIEYSQSWLCEVIDGEAKI